MKIFKSLRNIEKSTKLVDVYLNEQTVWLTYKNSDDDEFKISYCNLTGIGGSFDLTMERRNDNEDEFAFAKDVDHKEAYLKAIFEPYRFSKLTILKSLSVSYSNFFGINSAYKIIRFFRY